MKVRMEILKKVGEKKYSSAVSVTPRHLFKCPECGREKAAMGYKLECHCPPPKKERFCIICGNPLKGQQKKYCSRDCTLESMKGINNRAISTERSTDEWKGLGGRTRTENNYKLNRTSTQVLEAHY